MSADGTIDQVGSSCLLVCLLCDVCSQVKGLSYRVSDFLGETPSQVRLYSTLETGLRCSLTNAGNKIYQCILYLAPGDYHHFHSPATWSAATLRHFAGWPVLITRANLSALRALVLGVSAGGKGAQGSLCSQRASCADWKLAGVSVACHSLACASTLLARVLLILGCRGV